MDQVKGFVAVIVLNQNQTQYTRQCIDSLLHVTYRSFRILVVDNGSADDSLRPVAGEFPGVDFLWLAENLGVAGGRNAGLRRVLEIGEHPEYILFLDNDTLVAPDFLSKLVARMERDPLVGAVQPKILFADPSNRICSVGGKLYPRIAHYRHPGSGQLDSQHFQEPTDIDIVSGCAGLIRSAVFREIGLLDETYSPYCHEDVDWSLRMRLAGYRLMMEPSSVIWHCVSTKPQTSPTKLKQLSKGHVLFLRFHTRFYDLPASLLWVSLHIARIYLLPAVGRANWESAAAIFGGLWTGLRQERCPIERLPTRPESLPPKTQPPIVPAQPQKKILLVGVLGPFDSGPTRVYETLLKSRFTEHFQVRFLDLRFAKSVADFEQLRAGKFFRLIWYLLTAVYGLLCGGYSALCIPLSTNRNAFLKDSLFAWLGYLFDVPVIILEHGTNIPSLYERSGWVVRWFMRATLKRTARCLVLADCLKFNFECFLPADRIVSVYLGIDELTSKDRPRFSKGKCKEQLTVLYLSTLVRSKGILVLLDSVSRVPQVQKDIRFVIAGGWGRDSPEVGEHVERWLSRDAVKNKVSFIGPIQGEEKVRVLLEADVFVLPTLDDTAPLVVLEAMRAGLPIISTDVGAIPEIVRDGQNGLICARGNAGELAEKILYLAERPVLREKMSQNNVERFENLFTTEKFANRMIEVFESVIGAIKQEMNDVEVVETRVQVEK